MVKATLIIKLEDQAVESRSESKARLNWDFRANECGDERWIHVTKLCDRRATITRKNEKYERKKTTNDGSSLPKAQSNLAFRRISGQSGIIAKTRREVTFNRPRLARPLFTFETVSLSVEIFSQIYICRNCWLSKKTLSVLKKSEIGREFLRYIVVIEPENAPLMALCAINDECRLFM